MTSDPSAWEILGSRLRELAAGEQLTCTAGAVWMLVLDGTVRIRGRGTGRTLGAGDAALVRRPSVHAATALEPTRAVVAELRLPGTRGGAEVEVAPGFAGRQGGVVALLTTCPLDTAAQLDADDRAAGLRPAYGQLLAAAMRAVAREEDELETPCLDPAVRAVALAVTDDVARPWTRPELERVALLGRTALTARFRRDLGMAPMQFVRRARIERAAQELRRTDRSVTAIGAAVGYGSTAAFVRAFVAEMGRSPGAWRQAEERTRSAPNPIAPSSAASAPSSSAARAPA